MWGVRCRVGVESGGDFTTFHGFSIGEPENMGCCSKEVLLMDTKNPALFSEEAFKVEGEIDFFLKKYVSSKAGPSLRFPCLKRGKNLAETGGKINFGQNLRMKKWDSEKPHHSHRGIPLEHF